MSVSKEKLHNEYKLPAGVRGAPAEPLFSKYAAGPPSLVSEAPFPTCPYHHINNTCLLNFPGMMDLQKPSLNPQKFASISKRFPESLELYSVPLPHPRRCQAQCLTSKDAHSTGPLKPCRTLKVIYPTPPPPRCTDGEAET